MSRFSTVKNEDDERFESYAHAKEALVDQSRYFRISAVGIKPRVIIRP